MGRARPRPRDDHQRELTRAEEVGSALRTLADQGDETLSGKGRGCARVHLVVLFIIEGLLGIGMTWESRVNDVRTAAKHVCGLR